MGGMKLEWEAELDELLSICESRAGRANVLPHCAICARYAGASPAFEGILSLLEKLPVADQPRAVAMAAERLAKVPASQRSQQVQEVNFGPLLDSPGWPLVGSLVIDMGNEETARHLQHPGLAKIEELTLLGFAYGNAVAGRSFTAALLDSNLRSVRVLTLHSTDLEDEDRAAFWSSPFAARLERIEGIIYRGEMIPQPLQAQEIKIQGVWNRIESLDYLLRLISPSATPHLRKLSVGSYYAEGAAPVMMQLLEQHRREFERIPELEISLYGRDETMQQKLRGIRWPASMEKISWNWHSMHGLNFGMDDDLQWVYCPHPTERVAGYDTITDYPQIVSELADVSDLSLDLKGLNLIAPPTATLEELQAAVLRFQQLTRLVIVYPFSEVQLSKFLAGVSQISQVEVYVTMKTGSFTTPYRQEREARYQSDVSPQFLLKTALEREHLSIYSDALDVSHTPSGIEHLTVKSEEAVCVLAASDPEEPIEALTIETPLTETGAEALAKSTLLGRVFRLKLEYGASDEAAAILAKCPGLRSVRILNLTGSREHNLTVEGFARVIGSQYLAGVLDLSLGNTPEGGDKALAEAPLLPRLVKLDLYSERDSDILPASGRLRSLRSVSEWLSMSLFGDGRQAQKWLRAGTALPLRSRVQKFAEWIYRVPEEPLGELLARLDRCATEESDGSEEKEEKVRECLRDVVAKAFEGTAVPDGEPFASLTLEQQSALRAITKLEDRYWGCGVASSILASYGLPRVERVQLERYFQGKDIWGHDEG